MAYVSDRTSLLLLSFSDFHNGSGPTFDFKVSHIRVSWEGQTFRNRHLSKKKIRKKANDQDHNPLSSFLAIRVAPKIVPSSPLYRFHQVLLNDFPFHNINLLATYFIMPGKDIIYSPATFWSPGTHLNISCKIASEKFNLLHPNAFHVLQPL